MRKNMKHSEEEINLLIDCELPIDEQKDNQKLSTTRS